MKIKITDSQFSHFHTGFNVTPNTDIELDGVSATNFIQLVKSDDHSLAGRLGLPPETPSEDIINFIDALKNMERPTKRSVADMLSASPLKTYLGVAANVAEIANLFLQFIRP